ncbi:hypothetical protein [Niabella drilacis]|uniref:Uncharacterized protein n=1 Tax=Niabella drilacis (strain DSM 25811 / CCM 8410 / CCUG 62505 / LMG 26954 / E90) TaxID=1285928 RepID=A0A1G6YBY0_NIADE|nr:hypothetical protein [Niabella drilacis]SDD87832.1 hypothetical protein SAMN04487894_11558 [Niabella drilacis]
MIKKVIIYFLAKCPAPFRDFVFSIKRYTLFPRPDAPPPFFLLLVDGGIYHGGFADRMKGIVSCFAFCRQNDIPFRIHYTFPFPLDDFLVPNEYDWTLKNDEFITRNFAQAKYLNLVGSSSIKRLTQLKKGKQQVHCYANRDVLEQLNTYYHTHQVWGDLFRQLFRPAAALQQELNNKREQLPAGYTGVAFRFQNLLGDFEEYKTVPLVPEEQSELIDRCRSFLVRFQQQLQMPLFVTSDSYIFSQSLSGLENIYCFPAQNLHLDHQHIHPSATYLKSFIDFFLLSESRKVYAAGTKQMYATEFPVYAARLNGRPFERLLIE